MQFIENKIKELEGKKDFLQQSLEATEEGMKDTANKTEEEAANTRKINASIKKALPEIDKQLADLRSDLETLKEKEANKPKEFVVLHDDMEVYKRNVRTSKGNRARKDRVLKAGKYEILKKWTDLGMVRHGNTIAQVQQGEEIFTIDLTMIESK